MPYARPINNIRGTVNWANIFLNKALRVVYNGGVGGERIQDWMDRFKRDCEDHQPHIVVITDPINDLKNTVNGATANSFVRAIDNITPFYLGDNEQTNLQSVISRYAALIDRVINLGAVAVCMGVSAPNPVETTQLGIRCVQFNDWLRRHCSMIRGAVYAPVQLATTDPLSLTGISFTAAYPDAIHPGAENSFFRGKILASVLRPFVPAYWDPLIPSVADCMEVSKLTVTEMRVVSGNCVMTVNNGAGFYAGGISPRKGNFREGDYVTYNSQSFPDLNGTYLITNAPVGNPARLRGVKIANTQIGMNGVDTTAGQEAYMSLQAMDNPLFATTTGGTQGGTGSAQITGNVPAGLQIQNSSASCNVALSTAAHTDAAGVATGFGNWLNLDITSTADATVTILIFGTRDEGTLASAVYGRVFGEEIVQSTIEVEVVGGATTPADDPVGVRDTELRTQLNVTPVGDVLQTLSTADLFRPSLFTEAFPQEKWRGVLQTSEWKIPKGKVRDLDAALYIRVLAGCDFRIRIARPSIYKLYHGLERTLENHGRISPV
jgi:hypothetical protein